MKDGTEDPRLASKADEEGTVNDAMTVSSSILTKLSASLSLTSTLAGDTRGGWVLHLAKNLKKIIY